MALLPARNERTGGSSGPGYTTNAMIKARNRARAWLARNFTIVPDTGPAQSDPAPANQPSQT